jgi:hypothetical protein
MYIVPSMFFYEFEVRRCSVYANPNRVAAPSRMLNLVLHIRQDICNAWACFAVRRSEANAPYARGCAVVHWPELRLTTVI